MLSLAVLQERGAFFSHHSQDHHIRLRILVPGRLRPVMEGRGNMETPSGNVRKGSKRIRVVRSGLL